jgi:hypothetical protein
VHQVDPKDTDIQASTKISSKNGNGDGAGQTDFYRFKNIEKFQKKSLKPSKKYKFW